jgi:hypothetical protein
MRGIGEMGDRQVGNRQLVGREQRVELLGFPHSPFTTHE